MMRNFIKRITACILALTLIFSCTAVEGWAISTKPVMSQTNEIRNSNSSSEYFIVKTPLNEKGAIYVKGKTASSVKRYCIRIKNMKTGKYYITAFVKPNSKGEIYIKINTKKGNKKVPAVISKKGTVTGAKSSYSTVPGYKAVEKMPAGVYMLTIAKATTTKDANVSKGVKWWNGTLGGKKGYCLNNVLLQIKSGQTNNPKLVKYTAAYNNNVNLRKSLEPNDSTASSYKGSYVRYTDKYMKDLAFIFKNPKTGKYSYLTASKVNYLNKVSNIVTREKDSDYAKLKSIYKYVATNFYYDTLANKKFKNQYADPYRNIYNLRNKKASENSTNTGKIATTCQGYAGAVVALARAEGIPARLVYGRHLTLADNRWENLTVSQINKSDHWWAEAYVNNRWVVIDANAGTSNKWERSSFSSKGTWKKTGLDTYSYFDPTTKYMSNNFITNTIYKGSSDGKYACYKSEVSNLKGFLNTTDGQTTNGKKLNSNYKSTTLSTWGNGKENNIETDGFGRYYRIVWPNEDLYGNLNLQNFKELKYLTVYSNKLTGLNISGCSKLTSIYASYNDIKNFDGSSCNLNIANLRGNELNTAKLKHNKNTVLIKSNDKNCYFGFKYDKASYGKELTVYIDKVSSGYEYLGIYDVNGKKISSATEYSFTPGSGQYTVKYQKTA